MTIECSKAETSTNRATPRGKDVQKSEPDKPNPVRARALGTSEWVPYANANKAAQALNLGSSSVYKCLAKQRTHAGGYEFEIDMEAVPQRVCNTGKRRSHEFVEGVEHTQCSGPCKEMKPIDQFCKNKRVWDGLAHVCKSCTKAHLDDNKQQYKEYRQNTKKRRAENHARWYRENKQRVFGYMYSRYHTRTDVRLKQLIGHRICEYLKGHGKEKEKRTIEYAGCTLEHLQCHLERQFDEFMTWKNMGRWHIDHRVPCAAFDSNNPAEAAAMWHFTNLQPMWAADNLRKKDSCPLGAKEAYMRAWMGRMF